MAVTCRHDVIEEVRICFSKDLRGFVVLSGSGARLVPTAGRGAAGPLRSARA